MKDDFIKLLQRAIQKDASDIHLKTDSPPFFRVDGDMRRQPDDPIVQEQMEAIVTMMLSDEQLKQFLRKGEIDLSFSQKGVGRFRVNMFRQRGTVSLVMRRIKTKILDFKQLHLPDSVERFAQMVRGLVLITGTTGSGKSTTLASMIDYINDTRRCHIITVEDPIEYVHQDKQSVVNQREVSIDTADFQTALRAAMREDPDVILIGEMRDVETFQAAVTASETGHLVFSTLHTTNVIQTIDRIVDLFPTTQQDQVRSALATQLRAIMCMRLLPRADGNGRVPACELMFVNSAVRALIRENRVNMLGVAIQQGRESGMQTFNDSLCSLIKKGLISNDIGMEASDNPEELSMMMQGITLGSMRGGILRSG